MAKREVAEAKVEIQKGTSPLRQERLGIATRAGYLNIDLALI